MVKLKTGECLTTLLYHGLSQKAMAGEAGQSSVCGGQCCDSGLSILLLRDCALSSTIRAVRAKRICLLCLPLFEAGDTIDKMACVNLA